jgi:DNA-binding NtrC family response regulator
MSDTGAANHPGPAFSCLIVEDDAGFASLVAGVVREAGGEPVVCGTLAEADRATAGRAFDLLLLDNHLPDGKAYDFFRRLSRRSPEAPAILITGAADLTEAIELTRNGLFDYLTKPIGVETLEGCLQRALARLRQPKAGTAGEPSLGESPAMREVRQQLREAARHVDAAVLITGESGVGKDVAVRALHRWTFGERAEAAAYIPVNCAAIPAEMFEAELFGAERGAYTGADRRRTGLVAAAQDGTLFLDEIGEVPLGLQAKLLRFLESREYRPLGAVASQRFSGRLVAATNKPLRAEVAAGRFREDLLFRIEVFAIAIPPLRERREDIPALAEQLLAGLAGKYGRTVPLLREADLTALHAHDFPGNIRELRNILERALLRTPADHRWLTLDPSWLGGVRTPGVSVTSPASPGPLPPVPASAPVGSGADEGLPPERADLTALEAQEYRLIRAVLRETRGGIRRTAVKVGLSPQALLRRLEKWPELRLPAS